MFKKIIGMLYSQTYLYRLLKYFEIPFSVEVSHVALGHPLLLIFVL